MIVDARENPASLPLCAQVYRPEDGAWYDPETCSWRADGKLPARYFPYSPVSGLDDHSAAAIPTPPETWGLNVAVIVFVFAYMDVNWEVVDRFAMTVNPAGRSRSQVRREALMKGEQS